jgi:iron complex transport system substrate-binding protein
VRIVGWRTNLSGPVAEPRRIVSVGPSNTEILFALGLGDRIVGVDRWSDYPPLVLSLPRVGSDLHVDISAVAALSPDLVIASLHVPGMEDNLPLFESAALPYLAVGGMGLEGVFDDMLTVGRFVQRLDLAVSLVDSTRARMAVVRDRYAAVSPRPRVHWEWSAHPYVAARRSWITELLDMAGADNVYFDLDVESTRIEPLEAIARKPDVVVACWCGARKLPTVDRILRRPGWQSVPAMQSGRVAVFAEDLFGRPGPRLADGLEQLAALLHGPH